MILEDIAQNLTVLGDLLRQHCQVRAVNSGRSVLLEQRSDLEAEVSRPCSRERAAA